MREVSIATRGSLSGEIGLFTVVNNVFTAVNKMRYMIKAVIFDLGGVLTKYHYNKFQKELAKYLKVKYNILSPAVTPLLELFNKGEIIEDEFWKMLAENLKIELPQDYRRFIQYEFEKDVKLNTNAEKILQKIKKSNYKLALISTIFKPHAKFVKQNGWLKDFDVVVMSCDVGLLKTDKQIFKLTLKMLGLKGNQCIYVDDKKEHLVPAKNVEMKTILFKSTTQLKKELGNLLSY